MKEIRIIDKDERDLQKDLEICEKATQGPWFWDVNKHTWHVLLEGPKRIVMDFVRWGMGSAQPRFIQEGIFDKAVDLAIERKANHVGFDMDIMHPDAQFIAQARTGWPEAIQRAIEAESKLTKIQRILREPAPFGAISEQLDQIREVVADE